MSHNKICTVDAFIARKTCKPPESLLLVLLGDLEQLLLPLLCLQGVPGADLCWMTLLWETGAWDTVRNNCLLQ